ncbi:MAG: radical SAM family heme chaperone HemW [Rickettsiales bacterium]
MSSEELSVYIHWPFCLSKCPYCDFNSHVRDSIDQNLIFESYKKEISYFEEFLKNKKIKTIFFGGGTPSLMNPKLVEQILNSLNEFSYIAPDTEISLEANPTSYEINKFLQFKKAGINRVSIGVQSLRDNHLKFLGREHSSEDAIAAIESASEIFDNYNIDLMYSLPEQTNEEWLEDLSRALTYSTKHISLYQLTIEKGTRFFTDFKNQKFAMPDDEKSASMYSNTMKFLKKNGFEHYEISNFAKPGFECRHNLNYWKYRSYLGIGAGAHSRLHHSKNKVQAITMLHSPENWVQSIKQKGHAIQSEKFLSKEEIATEKILMGLRHFEGVRIDEIKDFINQINLKTCISQKLLKASENKLCLTEKGTLLLNSILSSLLT